MGIFLTCNENGNIIDVVLGKTFDETYKKTVGLNNGELLIEMDEQILIKIDNLKGTKISIRKKNKVW